MKRFATWTILTCLMTLSAFSQTTIVDVSGRIVEGDTQQPAIAASVQLLNLPDSSQVTGMASNTNGLYRLQAKPGKYVLKVTYIGYQPSLVPVQLSSAPKRMKDIVLQPDAILLAEAVVVAEAPQVQVVEDTIQFNSSAYRTPQGAVLEDLVEKLPGAEVDESGNVKINGKDISKVMVNGQEYNIPFGTTADGTGLIDNTYILPVSSETIRTELYTLNYGAFMIDEIRFMQTLKKGDMVRTAVTSASTDGETTSYTFTNLADYGYDMYGYNVVSSFELEGESTTSAPSDLVTVNLETGESEITTGIEDATQGEPVSVVARYSLDGRLLTAPQRGVNILKMSDGTTRKVVVK